MDETRTQVGELLARPFSNGEWTRVRVELTEERIKVKMRDWIQEDTLATYEFEKLRSITLRRDDRGKLGLYIQGGLEYKSPIKINKTLDNSPASKANIASFDIILKVNGISVWGKTHDEVSKIIKDSGDEVTFEIGKLKEREAAIAVDEKWINIGVVPLDRALVTKFKPGTCTLRPCTLEVMSKDAKERVTFKCDNEGECGDWNHYISRHIQQSFELKMEEYNYYTGSDDDKIIKMGWVYEHMPANQTTSIWCQKALILKKTSLLMYEIMPDAVEEFERPEKCYNLLEMTLKVIPPHSFQNQRPNTLVIYSAGETHTISCETTEDLSSWTTEIHRATVKMVINTKCCYYDGTWENRRISLGLHIDKGILILEESQLLWQKPFSLICQSSDDTQSKLQITFYTDSNKEDKEDLVLELQKLQLAICGLDCFMTTKVALKDPQFIAEKTDILVGSV